MMLTESGKSVDCLDPALAADKRFLIKAVAQAKLKGGYTFGFKSASEARSTRRRMYYVIEQMAEFDQRQMAEVMFKLTGRMIAIVPKRMLSSLVTEETSCPDTQSAKTDTVESSKQS